MSNQILAAQIHLARSSSRKIAQLIWRSITVSANFCFSSISAGKINYPVNGSKTRVTRYLVINVFQNTRMPPNPRQAWMQINLSDRTLLSVA